MKANLTKATFVVAAVIMFAQSACAQEFKDRFFYNNGFSIYTEAFFGRKFVSSVEAVTDINGVPTGAYTYTQQSVSGFSIFTYTANFRYNVSEPDNNTSFAVNVPVGLGLMASDYGFGSINLPVFLSWNTGNVSTYSADKNNGFTVGLGFEYYNMALFSSKNSAYDIGGNIVTTKIPGTSWVEPCLNVGFRYWNSKNVAREFNLKFGYGPSTSETIGNQTVDDGHAITVKLTWYWFSKY